MDIHQNQSRVAPLAIEANDVCVDYNGNVALYDATLKIQPGSICGLVGMNGAGKSTFFKSLMGFVRPSRGSIKINGLPVSKAQRDQMVAYVPQSDGVDCSFPVSVWDVVMMGRYGSMNIFRIPRESDRKAVWHALERVELIELRNRPIGELSGGQRKRTFMARAIAQRASVLLLDEPFAGVDVRTEKLLSQLFLQFRKENRTILISTHDFSHIRDFCDLVVLINKTVLAYGETSQIFTEENLNRTFGGMSPDVLFGASTAEELPE